MEQPEYHAWRKQFIAERGRPPTAYEAWQAALEWSRAQRTEQAEPVAWRYKDRRGHWRYCGKRPHEAYDALLKPEPVYAHPPASTAQDKEKQG